MALRSSLKIGTRVLCLVLLLAMALMAACAGLETAAGSGEPLPSWSQGQAKSRIISFVQKVTTPGLDFVPPAQRVAVFDNDGTLWVEKPVSIPMAFDLAYLRDRARAEPALRSVQPYKGAWDGDTASIFARGIDQGYNSMMNTHQGTSTGEYRKQARSFLAHSKHPRYKRPYQQLTYLPMVELLAYLRANDFTVYIVSGGEMDLIRSVAPSIYRVPVENVIGSRAGYEFDDKKKTSLVRRGLAVFACIGPHKAAAIYSRIGCRPILAFGNSNGDIAMLRYTTDNKRPSLGLLLHHDDSGREYAYNRGACKALARAGERDYVVVSMKNDFKRLFAFE